MVCERYVETGVQVLRVALPAVITVLKDANVPRIPSLRGKMRARTFKPVAWGAEDLGLTPYETGLEGSPTKVVTTATPEARTGGSIHTGTPEELASIMADLLLGREDAR